MRFNPTTDDQAAQAITRLVDGTLDASEREGVEAWAAADPDIARQVAMQRRVAVELASSGPEPPERLLASIEERFRASGRAPSAPKQPEHPGQQAHRAPQPARRRRAGARGGRSGGLKFSLMPGLALGAAAVVAVAVVVAVGSGGSGASPSINAAARLAFVPATTPAPKVSSARFLDVSYHGVTFPNYAKLDAVPTGQLVNTIGGRPALTVYYRLHDGARLSYTVFSGRPVGLPAAAHLVRYEGVELRVYHLRDGLSVVTLVRSGRTCVLAARTVEDVVLGLAAEPVLSERV